VTARPISAPFPASPCRLAARDGRGRDALMTFAFSWNEFPVCDHDQQQQFDHDPCPIGWRRRYARRAISGSWRRGRNRHESRRSCWPCSPALHPCAA